MDLAMNPTDIHLHIESLVLEGLPFTPGDAPHLEAAIVGELRRQLAANPAFARGLPPGLRVVSLAAPALAIPAAPAPAPAPFGAAVAQSLAGALRTPPPTAKGAP
ncbi:MAG: hypothetical protein ACOYK7_12910 [Pirellulales bacterium]|jgi:hypothetical protein